MFKCSPVLGLALLIATSVGGQPRVVTVPAGEPALTGKALPHDALPGTHVGHGKNDIVDAWLAEPTERLKHGILGDWLEAGAVRVRTRTGAILSYRLPDDSVFEDLYPRVHDIDGDGIDELFVVRSRQRTGSSVMALGIRGGALVPLAETEPTGGPKQWINPVGVADVNGDGSLELVVVLAPHRNGILVSYRYSKGQFTERQRVEGVSNHVIGSRSMKLSAFMDVNGDGVPEVIIASADRRTLRAIGFTAGRVLDHAQISLPSPAAGDFEVHLPYTLIVPLEDGRKERVIWR